VKATDVILIERHRNEAHVEFQVRGFGMPGDRPLLGSLRCSVAEAAWLQAALSQARTVAEVEAMRAAAQREGEQWAGDDRTHSYMDGVDDVLGWVLGEHAALGLPNTP
jgi:hypothetical protein